MVLLCQNTRCTFRQETPPHGERATCPTCGAHLCALTQAPENTVSQGHRPRTPVRRPSARPRQEPEGKIVGRRVDRAQRGGTWVTINGKRLRPTRSQQLINHSPDGFDWGYGGSGPAQLALAIALTFCRPSTAVRLYQDFKWQFVATFPPEGFELDTAVVQSWFLLKTCQLAA
jgi:Family of unknown function (DUF6166)